ncbi:efflux RND transporter periplasmic adaptor subunit [Leptospira sp. WS39.C2]
MKTKILTYLKSRIKYFVFLFVLYLLTSFLFTQYSNENIRLRFPKVSKILIQKHWLGVDQNIYANTYEKENPIFSKPTIIERNVSFEFPATVEATKEIQLQSKHQGRIQKIYVTEGQTVKKGDLLLELDDVLLRLEGEKLNISLEITKANQSISFEKWKQAENQIEVKVREIDKKTELLEIAKIDLETAIETKLKKETLWAHGFVSLSELEKWRLEVGTKQAQYQNLKRDRANLLSLIHLENDLEGLSLAEKLKVWKQQNTPIEKTEYELSVTNTKILENQINANKQMILDSKLFAPKSGKILKINFREGETTNHLPLISLMENGDLSVSFQVGESDLNLIKTGKKIEFISSLDEKTVSFGKIENVSGYLNSQSHGISVKAKLLKNYNTLLTGMFGVVKIETEKLEKLIIVPTTSVLGDENSGFYLLVKIGEVTEKRYIECRIYNDFETQVIVGLHPNDLFLSNHK